MECSVREERLMIRVLHIVTYMGRGGLETMLMNYYRHIDRNKVQFDFLVCSNADTHSCCVALIKSNRSMGFMLLPLSLQVIS